MLSIIAIESATRVQILDEPSCISFMLMPLENACTNFFTPQLWVNSRVDWQPVLEKENSKFRPAVLSLKIVLVLYPVQDGRVSK